ncbi:MAG: MBL fold metallo-hydrolase [Clostridiales bacterium]|nr:MBL fold metallo-hydrolase [Clostridiales bacterium]
MKIHFFGTCAGTEPMPGRKHVSFAVEKDNKLYWFDAGEGCSYTAHLMGVDLQSVKSIFISHSHMDHVGGLGNLLWNIRKLDSLNGRMAGKKIDVFIANDRTWNGVMQLLSQTEGSFKTSFTINRQGISDGEIYNEDGIRVSAFHNTHLGVPEDGKWMSYSLLIEAEGKRIAFSGDLGALSDIDPLIDNCDLLLMETGHFSPEDVCSHIRDKNVGTLGFIHSGRHILRDADNELAKAKSILGDRVFIAEDAMTIEI